MSVDSLFTKIVCPPCTPLIAAKFFTNKQKVFKGHSLKGRLNMASQSYGRQNLASPNEIQQRLNQKRQMQQFYLHKLFDLLLDAEFLPLIPYPVVAAIQMQETYAMNNATNNLSRYQPQNGSPAMENLPTTLAGMTVFAPAPFRWETPRLCAIPIKLNHY